MKKKKLNNLAKQIAQAEYKRKHATNKETRREAENEILRLSGSLTSLEDIIKLDEYIQENFKKLLDE